MKAIENLEPGYSRRRSGLIVPSRYEGFQEKTWSHRFKDASLEESAGIAREYSMTMARQYFQDGPYIDPPVAAVASMTPGSILPIWPAATYTPIFANDPKAGKIYCVRAGGILTMSVNTCSLAFSPKFGTGGVALGAIGPAQVMPVMSNVAWYLAAELVFTVIGNGGNSTAFFTGVFATQGTIATAGAGTNVMMGGGTPASTLNVTANANVEINVTAAGTVGSPSLQTQWAYIFSRN